MSAAAQPKVSDETDLRVIAAAIRAFAKRSGDRERGEINQKLEAVVAELLKLAKEFEDGADQQKRSGPLLVNLLAGPPKERTRTRFAPVAVAVIAVVAVGWVGGRWISSLGDPRTGATETALNQLAPMQLASPPTDPAAHPTELVALPPPVVEDAPPPPVTNTAPLPSPAANTAPPPPMASTALLPPPVANTAPRPPPMVGTAPQPPPVASAAPPSPPVTDTTPLPLPVASTAPPPPPRPRRDARRTAPADVPPAFRQPDLSRGRRDAASPPPPLDAADLPPSNQPPSAPVSQQAVLPSAAPRSPSIGGPIPLVAAAPELGSGGTGSTSPPNMSECVPYTSDTSMSGRDEPVQGLACRDTSGRWRRTTEKPRSH